MPLRSFRVNFRTRGGIDPAIWNQFWRNAWYDLNDLVGSGVEVIRSYEVGEEDFMDQYDVAVSGMAGKEIE